MARSVPLWSPRTEPSKLEARLLKRLTRVKKLFSLLRLRRHELFDAGFQNELTAMYRGTGAGRPEIPPAQICMALLLQTYTGTSDAEAVELTVVDARWRMVLDHYDEEPLFAQGTLQRFRERLIGAGLDQRLLERTVEIARESGLFDWKKVPKELTIAMDSRPFEGAGRVEDTFNLLGHAARKLASMASKILEIPFASICDEAGAPVLTASSIKAGLDVDWSQPAEKDRALEMLFDQIESLSNWLIERVDLEQAPLTPYLEALMDVCEQNVELAEGRAKMREGTAADRRISIEDEKMRHGRKNKRVRVDGYKEHVAADADSRLILAIDVSPANRPEFESAGFLADAIERQGFVIGELDIDRGYLASSLVDELESEGRRVNCKPWPIHKKDGLFTKLDFRINLEAGEVTCPAGITIPIRPGHTARFPAATCAACDRREACTTAKCGKGRHLRIRTDEARQQRLRAEQASPEGRARLRRRTQIEHRLAHMVGRGRRKARYRGVEKNRFDARRAAAVHNLEVLQRTQASEIRRQSNGSAL